MPASEAMWREPEKWNRKAQSAGVRSRVFCASLADVFENRLDLDLLRVRLFDLIRRTPMLDWQLLTKRPECVQVCLQRAEIHARSTHLGEVDGSSLELISNWLYGFAPTNVWLGTTVEDQKRADERIPALLNAPARIRFLSCEPLLGRIDLQSASFNGADSLVSLEGIHWVIVGGESGAHARQCSVEWIDDILHQCRQARVPCFIKQLGKNSGHNPEGTYFQRIGFIHSKGGDPAEWPDNLRVREMPEVLK